MLKGSLKKKMLNLKAKLFNDCVAILSLEVQITHRAIENKTNLTRP